MNPNSSGKPVAAGHRSYFAVRSSLFHSGILLLAVCIAYANSFSGVFVMDDHRSILKNPTLRSVSWRALNPPGGGVTVEGRPILNFSLAVDYALGGTDPRGYHATNLAIHLGAALALLGLLRRLLARGGVPHPDEVAFMTTLLWALHPLQTQSVTYIVQRAESLMGLFYVTTLYCAVRGITAATARNAWLGASVTLCALGMGTKEVMASAPLLAVLIDRTLFAGTFAAAWRERRLYYTALFATWLILLALIIGHGSRAGTVGAEAGVTWWQYALTQSHALLHYVRLSVWPFPLVFDYGSEFVTLAQAWWQGAINLGMLVVTFVALRRRAALGLAGAWFFFILAPTSSVIGGTRQMLAEHRMYLPLAAIVVVLVIALYRLIPLRAARWSCAALGVGLLAATIDRNADYGSELALYEDNFRKRPAEAHSLHDYGYALYRAGRSQEALMFYRAALRLKPDHAAALDDMASVLATVPRHEEELLGYYEAFLRHKPRNTQVLNNAAVVLLRIPGREAEAIARLEGLLQREPGHPEAQFNLAQAFMRSPERVADALAHYEAAVRLKPDYAEAHHGLGVYLALRTARQDQAVAHLQTAARLKPDWPVAHFHLAYTLAGMPGRANDARAHYETAVRLRPDYAEARHGLGVLLAGMPGRHAEAIAQLEAAVRAKPDYAEAHSDLGLVLLQRAGRPAEALSHFEAALRADPNSADAHFHMGVTLRILQRPQEAAGHLAAALKIRPDFAAARAELNRLRP